MKKAILIAVMLASTNVFAYDENPEHNFPTSDNKVSQTTITWISVDNVQARCESESRKRKFGGFGYAVEACSFWDKNDKGENVCTIVTGKATNMHTLGHETRHCFQGSWH